MNRKRILIIVGIILAIILGYLAWYLISPLFIEGPKGTEEIDLEMSTIISSGEFTKFDANHFGEGIVYLVNTSLAYQLLFVDVNIANGPDLYIYLSTKSSFSGIRDSAGDFYDLGTLDFTSGNFTVDIPNLDNINDYQSVLIWCKRFSVAFTYATLS